MTTKKKAKAKKAKKAPLLDRVASAVAEAKALIKEHKPQALAGQAVYDTLGKLAGELDDLQSDITGLRDDLTDLGLAEYSY